MQEILTRTFACTYLPAVPLCGDTLSRAIATKEVGHFPLTYCPIIGRKEAGRSFAYNPNAHHIPVPSEVIALSFPHFQVFLSLLTQICTSTYENLQKIKNKSG